MRFEFEKHVCLQLKGRVGTKKRNFGKLAMGWEDSLDGGRVQRRSPGDSSGHVERGQQRRLRRNRWRGSRETRRGRLRKAAYRRRGTCPSVWLHGVLDALSKGFMGRGPEQNRRYENETGLGRQL